MACIKKNFQYIQKNSNRRSFVIVKRGGYSKPGNKFINEHYRPKGKNNPSYGKSYNKWIPEKKWRSFEKAREYACPLGLKSEKHGLTIVSLERKKPNDIPGIPLITYTKVKAGQVFLTFWDITLGALCSGTR